MLENPKANADQVGWPSADEMTGSVLSSFVQSMRTMFLDDPRLRALDQMWNAHPYRDIVPVDWAEIARALRTVWLRSMSHPQTAMPALAELGFGMWQSAFEIWLEASRRWLGQASPAVAPARTQDKRFADREWEDNPAYRTLRRLYVMASDWLLKQSDAPDLDPAEQQYLTFHLRQFVDAMSPTLLLMGNPAAMHRAVETGGASLADGVRNLMRDLKAGRLAMVDETAFAPGRNLATTPGQVVYRNRLVELIQYVPSTRSVHSVPLLIIPPWINKFYILDMQPKNSLVRHLVAHGLTVFVVSWKNPTRMMDDITFEDYMELGLLETSDAVRQITGSPVLNVMGYCIGGTLLAITLAWLAARGDERFRAATFMVSLQDFRRVGDTALFLGETSIDFVERQMLERGYLDSREMANMFNLLRSNDLIWANVVNNYLLGNQPPAFDLLYWNSDGTRMARTAHSWYLHNTYIENNLIEPGKIEIKGSKIDLRNIRCDIYAVGAEKDHIVPWQAAWQINHLTGSAVRFVLASSGHIAGIINPPGGKGVFWTGKHGANAPTPEAWLESAEKHEGSWWTDWTTWLTEHSGRKQKPPSLGSATYPKLADAPGTYVLER
jgi:polyhydroxyalkanoate synthase